MNLNEEQKDKNEKELKKLKKAVKQVFDLDEINQLVQVSDNYKNIFKSKDKALNKLNRLADSLMVTSAYQERLIEIRNDMVKIKSKVTTLINKSKRKFYNSNEFIKMQKKNQEGIFDREIGDLYDFYDTLKGKMEIIDTNMKYLTDIQFNIKSCIKIINSNGDKNEQ